MENVNNKKLGFLRIFGFVSKLLRLLLEVTEVTTEHQK